MSISSNITVVPNAGNVLPKKCVYPQSNATARPILQELQGLYANRNKCASIYLDTTEDESDNFPWTEGADHHQGIARTHKLSDGSIYFFLTHSETDDGDKGKLMQFRYGGATDNSHIVQTNPFTVAALKEYLPIDEQHPCDLVFLPDVNNADAGYLFVAEERTNKVVIYYWQPGEPLKQMGAIELASTYNWPNYLFLDRAGDYYYLGIIATTLADNDNRNQTEKGWFYRAKYDELFPVCEKGNMNFHALKWYAPGMFDFNLNGYFPCQVKLVRDALQKWYLLAFRCDPDDAEHGTDYIDYHEIEFEPFRLGNIAGSVHIYLPGSSFASTGTHYVESSGRLLVSSTCRWSGNDGPGNSGYVSRLDECPSA